MSAMDKKHFPLEMTGRIPAVPRGPRQAPGETPREDADLFFPGRPATAPDKKQGRPAEPLQEELSLAEFKSHDAEIDWSKYEMPAKTDLHMLLNYRIVNNINPDILVKIGNSEFRCHLLVLQCYSSFFCENAVSRVELPEENVSQQAFFSIYGWMLHLKGDSYKLLRRDNLLEIFTAAQYLQVKELEDQCWAFIDSEDLFSEDKAFLLYQDARSRSLTAIMELMVPRVQRFFLTLVACQDFLELVVEEVLVFLRSSYICVHCEMEVFMSAVRWLMCDWEKRQKYLVDVMSCVRFGLISPWQLVDIRRNPENPEFLLVTKNPAVSTMIEDGMAFAIIKYWHGNDPKECRQETLGLKEPAPRNWAGTKNVNEQQKYTTYLQFLSQLAEYKELHKALTGMGDSAGNGLRQGIPNPHHHS